MLLQHYALFSFFNGMTPVPTPVPTNNFAGYLSTFLYPFFTGLGGDIGPTPPVTPSGGEWIVIYGRRRMRR